MLTKTPTAIVVRRKRGRPRGATKLTGPWYLQLALDASEIQRSHPAGLSYEKTAALLLVKFRRRYESVQAAWLRQCLINEGVKFRVWIKGVQNLFHEGGFSGAEFDEKAKALLLDHFRSRRIIGKSTLDAFFSAFFQCTTMVQIARPAKATRPLGAKLLEERDGAGRSGRARRRRQPRQ